MYVTIGQLTAEVFEMSEGEAETAKAEGRYPDEQGFWWWYCRPGCLPDGDAYGPHDTADAAAADAREDMEDWAADQDAQEAQSGK